MSPKLTVLWVSRTWMDEYDQFKAIYLEKLSQTRDIIKLGTV